MTPSNGTDVPRRDRPMRTMRTMARLAPWLLLVLVLHGLALRELPSLGVDAAAADRMVRMELAVVGELALADAPAARAAAVDALLQSATPAVSASVATWVSIAAPESPEPAASAVQPAQVRVHDEPRAAVAEAVPPGAAKGTGTDDVLPSWTADAAEVIEAAGTTDPALAPGTVPELAPANLPESLPKGLPVKPPVAASGMAPAGPAPLPAAGPTAPPVALAATAGKAIPSAAAPAVSPGSPRTDSPTMPPDLPPFEWPPSTRLSYTLTGQFRGEVHGRAQVEWIRIGPRYQVHLDVTVGLMVAPLFVRRMSSDGALTPAGLRPERYEEFTRLAFRDPRHVRMRLEPGQVWLADGRAVSAPEAVQDTASQFVQMAYRFALDPGLTSTGRTVELALALPRRVDPWTYDVIGTELLSTPVGPIEAVHLKPRPIARPGDTLTAEAWFAPRLRYLPVRIRIHQNDETFIDLLLERLPDVLAAPSAGVSVRSAADR
jgi:hypothetical protein